MKKTSILTIVMIGLFSLPLFAAPGDAPPATQPAATDNKLPDGGVEVSLAVVSNFVWRGQDLHKNYAAQNQKMYEAAAIAPAFQPSVTFSTPIDGLTVNLWGTLAMVGRNDVDGDQIPQNSPGGTYVDINTGYTVGTYPSTLAAFQTAALAGTGGLGATLYYKEENGLARSDELDITVDYSSETKKGNISVGIVHYGPQDIRGLAPATELYFAYSLPFLTQLKFQVNAEIQNAGSYYYNLGYSDEAKLSKTMTLNWGVGAGYWRKPSVQGISDITATVGISIGGFSVSLNAAQRPDFNVTDDGTDTNTKYSLATFGGSNNRDGLISDPSKTSGVINGLVNTAIQAQIDSVVGTTSAYVYTPRSKLPRTLFWVSAAYTIAL